MEVKIVSYFVKRASLHELFLLQAEKEGRPPLKRLERQILSETLRYEQEKIQVRNGMLRHLLPTLEGE